MSVTLKRLLRHLIRKRRKTWRLQYKLDTLDYDPQYSPSIDDLTMNLETTSLVPLTSHLEPPTTSVEAPIHRLPVEVLGLIFFYALDPSCHRRRFKPQVNDPPIVLCGVCKRWRDVAISMPMLWSTFHAYSVGKATNMALYRLWLERTRGAPLVINFDDLHVDEFDTALTLFFSHTHQWADVLITLQPLIYAKILGLRAENVPLLKKVHIQSFGSRFTKNDADGIILALAGIPTLSDLSWDFDIPASFSSFKWLNLRKFATRTRLQTGECLALLACFPQIEDIVFGDYVHSPINITSPITVINLCSLGIQSFDDPVELFNALTLPSLKNLQLPRPEDCSSLERLIDRSCCTLHHLTVDGLRDDLLNFLELKCFHSIYSLRLTSLQVLTDEVARRLTWDPESESSAQMFPYLSTISLEAFSATDGIASRMISSRWKGSHHSHGLKCVELSWDFLDSKHGYNRQRHTDIATLRCLREQGLQVVSTFQVY